MFQESHLRACLFEFLASSFALSVFRAAASLPKYGLSSLWGDPLRCSLASCRNPFEDASATSHRRRKRCEALHVHRS